ncbi:MAG: hypothetical protein LBC43_04860, partial [Bifidobacteriaceae bacterium]|nr:hypothetical protein [Bifidobacteriaceae bacterium]
MNKTPPANIAFVSGVSSVSDSVPPATSKSSAQSAALANNSVPPTAQNNPAASTAANSSGPPASAGSSVPPPRKSSLTKFLKRLPIINQLRISIGLQRGMLIAGLTMVVI